MEERQANILQQGNLPIRALAYSVLEFFQKSHLGFDLELQDEIEYNGLKQNILYDNGMKPIDNLASISIDRQINLNESYLAYLWCLSHAVVTFYREQNSSNPDPASNTRLSRAIGALNYGYSLFDTWSKWDLNLPNPEAYDIDVDPYIGEANGVMLIASRFILSHEYAHHYLDHTFDTSTATEEQIKEEEFIADKHAFEILMNGIGQDNPQMDGTIELGLVVGIGSLLFVSECWLGGDEHPDTDERVYRLLEMLNNNPDADNWRFGLLMLLMWDLKFNGKATDPSGHGSSKDDFIYLSNYLKSQQRC